MRISEYLQDSRILVFIKPKKENKQAWNSKDSKHQTEISVEICVHRFLKVNQYHPSMKNQKTLPPPLKKPQTPPKTNSTQSTQENERQFAKRRCKHQGLRRQGTVAVE